MTILQEPRDDQAVIILYHGVTDHKSVGIENFSGKHIASDVFDRQMAWLADNANPMSLREISMRLMSGKPLPPRSVAITFDDSYKNNATTAAPILKRRGVPATFFVNTGFIGTKRRYWTDKVEHAINAASDATIEIQLSLNEPAKTFDLTSRENRIAAVVAIKAAMKRLAPSERDALLSFLQSKLHANEQAGPVPNYENLTWDDVKMLDAEPGFEVGGHTVSHEILAYLGHNDCEREVVDCLFELEENFGHKVDLFSYPEGQGNHYNDSVIDIIKKAGVVVCPSAISGLNEVGADPFHLRRIMVGFMGTAFPWRDV